MTLRTMQLKPSNVRCGDQIIALEEFDLDDPIRVIGKTPTMIVLEPTSFGIARTLYCDQFDHVTVRRGVPDESEYLLDPKAHVMISDALLLMEERLKIEDKPFHEVRALITELHRFSDPTTDTDVVIRPRQ